MSTTKLTPEQQKLIKSFDEKDKKIFDALQTDDEKIRYLNDIIEIQALTAETSKRGTDDFVDSSLLEEQDDTLILRPGSAGLKAGTTMVAEFLGTMPMWSTKKQSNWKSDFVKTENGMTKEVWFNMNYRFRMNGKEFGIYSTPSLSVLKKVPTLATKINTPEKNPTIRIEYVGLVEGAERLKNDFGLEISDGNSAHVFKLGFEKDYKFNRYVKGVVNLLKTPKPNFGTEEGERKTLSEELFSSFEKYSTENDLMLDNNSSHSLAAPAVQ